MASLFDADHPLLLAAAVTPLTDGGGALDERAIWPYVAFLAAHGADGVFACGTTGEGILLSAEERMRTAVVFRAALRGILIVHCGAQSTPETVRLAAHAAEIGADGVAVIPPPYYPLDEGALAAHLAAAAAACAPLPFFIYAFTARSGYPVTAGVVERVREAAPNLAGLKVSDAPFEKVQPFLQMGLPVFVGQEPFIPAALAAGAIGSVSGLAAAWPDVVRAGLDDPTEAAGARLRGLRGAMDAHGFIASAKHVIARRGVPIEPVLRAPMRSLTAEEAAALDDAIDALELPLPA